MEGTGNRPLNPDISRQKLGRLSHDSYNASTGQRRRAAADGINRREVLDHGNAFERLSGEGGHESERSGGVSEEPKGGDGGRRAFQEKPSDSAKPKSEKNSRSGFHGEADRSGAVPDQSSLYADLTAAYS